MGNSNNGDAQVNPAAEGQQQPRPAPQQHTLENIGKALKSEEFLMEHYVLKGAPVPPPRYVIGRQQKNKKIQ